MLNLNGSKQIHCIADTSIVSYFKILSYAKDLIPDICGQYLNNSELQKY